MINNRFFFRCFRCLFTFTADVEGLTPPRVEACAVCGNQWVKCLGATKGVLSYGVACNDKCVFALGPDCSCSCAGKNHGSRLVVPVVKNVVDFTRRFPRLDEAARVWSSWSARVEALKAAVPVEVANDRARLFMYGRGLVALGESQAWPNREEALREFCARFGVQRSALPSAVGVASSSPLPVVQNSLAPIARPGDLFAWGEKWAEVSPQFRGHQFSIPDVDLGGGNIVRGVNFSPVE